MTQEQLRKIDSEYSQSDGEFRRKALFAEIKIGDRVTIETRHKSFLTGTARILNRRGGVVVLNGGGTHGTPLIACAENTVSVSRKGTGALKVLKPLRT